MARWVFLCHQMAQGTSWVTICVTYRLDAPAPVRAYLSVLLSLLCDIFRRTHPSYTRTHTRIHTYERYRGGAFFGKCHSSIYNKYIKYILTLEERERKICPRVGLKGVSQWSSVAQEVF